MGDLPWRVCSLITVSERPTPGTSPRHETGRIVLHAAGGSKWGSSPPTVHTVQLMGQPSSPPAPRRTRRRSQRPAPMSGGNPGASARADEVESPADPLELAPEEEDLGVHPLRHAIELDEARIDADAAKVVRRLVRHGFEAYLVGGCVRDLLLGSLPKDFDVATNARPEDVRTLFRNSRIIGRRFRLVHVLFGGGKVIETATFRRTPSKEENGDDLLIRSDNVFGSANEDAYRRDFTINGLFYDLENGEVLDWVLGMPDIRDRVVRTIGDPVVRFREDPVRILRAVKFSARLDLGIAPDVYDAMVLCRGDLAMAARPRVFEEVLRLMRGGSAHRSIWLCWETGILDVLLPELSTYLSDVEESSSAVWRLLSELDYLTLSRAQPLDDVVLWTALLLEPMREVCESTRDRVGAAHDFLEPVVDRLAVPRRIADAVRRIVAMLPRLESGRPGRFARTALYPLACEVLELTQASARTDATAEPGDEAPESDTQRKATRRRRRRRRKPRGETAGPAS
jgi:poly(A) polymerase